MWGKAVTLFRSFFEAFFEMGFPAAESGESPGRSFKANGVKLSPGSAHGPACGLMKGSVFRKKPSPQPHARGAACAPRGYRSRLRNPTHAGPRALPGDTAGKLRK